MAQSDAAEALREASYGRFDAAERALERGGLLPTWRVALEAASWLAGMRDAAPGEAPALEGDPVGVACAAHRVTLTRLLARDASFFAGALPEDPAWESARSWSRIARGEVVDPAAPSGDDPDHAALVIEHTVLRAFAALNDGAFEEATALARRASRMARTEGMPQSTYLANITLARVRRLNGHPWLATRILRGLADVAPPAWRPWLAWEMVMASGRAAPPVLDAGAADLAGALDAARRGDCAARDAALEALTIRCRGFSFLERDVETARAAIDLAHRALAPALEAFAVGGSAEPPRGMVGLAGLDEDAPDVAVCVGPGAPARRVLWMAAPTFAPPPTLAARPGRTETALAVLAFAAADGLPEAELFRRAYGFAYERELHKGVLGVLVHRMRAWVGDAATVHRESGKMWMTLLEPLVVPDPRCERPTEARVLVLLGRHGLTTAKQAAGTLSISVRSAQAALQALVEDGSLERVREGRKVGYVLEDTTFEEPTRA